MNRQLNTLWSWKKLIPTAIAVLTLASPFVGLSTADARPGHGKAKGHAKQDNWRHRDNRWDQDRDRKYDRWDRKDGVRHRTRSTWNNNNNRRYRLRYRTVRNSNGTYYRQWFRQYY